MRRAVALLAVLIAALVVDLAGQSQELNSRGRPRVSPRRVADGIVDGVTVHVEYGSPYKRGRVIWGTLVPFGRWWMPGADETTTLTTSAALKVGPLEVPAGIHSIYSMPGAEKFVLIVNKGTNLFHTSYPSHLNLGEVPMTMATIAEPLEQLTFSVQSVPEGGGVLKMAWDDREYAVTLAHVVP